MDEVLELLKKKNKKTVFISDKQLNDLSLKKLYINYFKDTEIYNVIPMEDVIKYDIELDIISNEEFLEKIHNNEEEKLYAVRENKKLSFYFGRKKIEVEVFSLTGNIFSRNKTILETSSMLNKKAVIIGCGSVGSLVAIELAKSGVGNFLLIDSDVLEYHNICRHQCGIDDVGDLKINALERKLKTINPYVNVKKFEGIIQNAPKTLLDEFCTRPDETIFVAMADNRVADVYANRISNYYGIKFISIGFWERAFVGEVFYHIPNSKMPCYRCALGEGSEKFKRVEDNHHAYSNKENLEDINFEPGISVDINFVTIIGIKLIIDLLNMDNEEFIPRVLNDLEQYTLICNTSNPNIGGEMVNIFSYPLQVTTSLKVAFSDIRCKEDEECRFFYNR